MASLRAVAASLKMLGRAFAGVVDEARADVYAAALEDVTDDQVAAATARLIKTHPGEFIPPPAAVRRAAGVDAAPAIDVDSVVRSIARLASYSPVAGMQYPPVRVVREQLGEAIAYAYAAAGGSRIFVEDITGEAIARREFQKALEGAIRPGAELTVWSIAPAPVVPRLPGVTS